MEMHGDGDGDVEEDGDVEGDVKGDVEMREWIGYREIKESTQDWKICIPAPYIGATMHHAPKGEAIKFCCVNNFQTLFHGFFFSSPRIA